ncbi:MAG: cell shape determination protein CcmA [Candidatus Saganbacteria bacterium]|uniref:Cell shape determination protein CcmA n=1 Tax=Candidatus Saganbacteria bacterium TaxID=2575572 RepID=A0A833L243_UNCSA|nr:MAG: cell shape determination protein CcmA [Candidatus Saganbacteria bacterium]
MEKKVINSIIGEGTTIKGEINCPGSLQLEGEVVGSIKAVGDIFIAGKGKVAGDLKGARVVVSGIVEGNIIAEKGLEILKTGKVNGEITCDKLLIEEGSSYQGKVNVPPQRNENY